MLRRYITNFDSEQIDKQETDCLIIGGGVAGLATAWYASQAGLKVTVAVRDTMLDSNTNKAQGGIAVALGEDDSLDLHIEDTLIAGAGLCTEDIVALVVDEGRQAVLDLIKLGAKFDSDENGICLGREGCHSRSRVIHAQGDATGREVVRALLHRVREEERITLREHLYAIDLLTTDSVCEGALFMREDGTKEIIRAKTVVLATGGLGRLYLHTTNPEGATGSALAMAYRAGASLMDMEFVQFHPTALAIEGLPNFLISEAVRGAGGLLRNAEGNRFMPRFHKMEELAPRDVVARAIYHEMQRADTLSVSLDVSQIEDFASHFPTITASCKEYGLNLPEDMIPVAPAAHYMMGGVQTDQFGETSVNRLFACGEAACTGLHGANRLASNSLLEGLAFGKRIAETIARRGYSHTKTDHWYFDKLTDENCTVDIVTETLRLKMTMTKQLGLIRQQQGLARAQDYFASMAKALKAYNMQTKEQMELFGMLQTGSLICLAAAMRQESRGGHYRSDYPQTMELWRKHLILQK